jgi:hypothetical protein
MDFQMTELFTFVPLLIPPPLLICPTLLSTGPNHNLSLKAQFYQFCMRNLELIIASPSSKNKTFITSFPEIYMRKICSEKKVVFHLCVCERERERERERMH